jgi:hypothetical protein
MSVIIVRITITDYIFTYLGSCVHKYLGGVI